jgi:hypothetical protein
MKFILFLMLFTTQPANGPKIESKRVWSLQSTSTLEFATSKACNQAGDAITKSLQSVGTLTVRGWCFCESTDPTKRCPTPTPQEASKMIESQDAPAGVSTGIQTLRPPDFR